MSIRTFNINPYSTAPFPWHQQQSGQYFEGGRGWHKKKYTGKMTKTKKLRGKGGRRQSEWGGGMHIIFRRRPGIRQKICIGIGTVNREHKMPHFSHCGRFRLLNSLLPSIPSCFQQRCPPIGRRHCCCATAASSIAGMLPFPVDL